VCLELLCNTSLDPRGNREVCPDHKVPVCFKVYYGWPVYPKAFYNNGHHIFTAPTCRTSIITTNLVHEMLSFNISYPDLIKLPNFADLTQRGDRGWKEAQREGEDRMTLWISLWFHQIIVLLIFGSIVESALQWWTGLKQEAPIF